MNYSGARHIPGQWDNYNELYQSVQNYFSVRPDPDAAPRLTVSASDFNVDSTALGYRRGSGPAVGQRVNYNGRLYVVSRVVSQGGGNVVSQGGGNILTNNGGTLITSDGAGMTITLHPQ
jgi:hypothetical protein